MKQYTPSVERREVPVEQGWGPVRGRGSPCYVWEGSQNPDAADGRDHTGADQVYRYVNTSA